MRGATKEVCCTHSSFSVFARLGQGRLLSTADSFNSKEQSAKSNLLMSHLPRPGSTSLVETQTQEPPDLFHEIWSLAASLRSMS
jgi:hypothetical protein